MWRCRRGSLGRVFRLEGLTLKIACIFIHVISPFLFFPMCPRESGVFTTRIPSCI